MSTEHDSFLERLRGNIVSLPQDPLHIDGFRAAAVVVPLINANNAWELIFTVRSKQLSNHAGQISFPGGKVDEGESLEEAAVRELREEVGLDVERIIGPMHSHPSPAKFIVTPVVAVLNWPQELTINPAEVDEVFSVPLNALATMEPRLETRTIKNDTRVIRFYDYEQRSIWGLTGNIIHDLVELSRES